MAAGQTNPGAPGPVPTTAFAGYTTDFNNQQHVIFISANSHVNEFWHQTSEPTTWHWNDLTLAATGVPAALQATSLAGYQTTFNSQEHVDFVGPGNQVFELFYNGTIWQFSNLSALANITSVSAQTGALDGYQTTFNNQQHVNFLSSGDNNVRELFFDGTAWLARDLTSCSPPFTMALPAAPTSKLSGYQTFQIALPPGALVTNEQEHVDYVDGDGDIHELIHGP